MIFMENGFFFITLYLDLKKDGQELMDNSDLPNFLFSESKKVTILTE